MSDSTKIDPLEQIGAKVERLLDELTRLRAKNKTLSDQIKTLEARQSRSAKAAREPKAPADVQRRLDSLIARLESAEAELV